MVLRSVSSFLGLFATFMLFVASVAYPEFGWAESASHRNDRVKPHTAQHPKNNATKTKSEKAQQERVSPQKTKSALNTHQASNAAVKKQVNATPAASRSAARTHDATQAKTKSNTGEGKQSEQLKSSQNQLSEIHEQIETMQKDLADKQDAHADAADALKESEKSISDSNRKLYELKLQRQAQQASLDNLAQQKARLEQTIKTQKQLLSEQFYRQYVHGKPSYVRAVLQAQQPGAVARQVAYMRYISKARDTLINDTNSNLVQVIVLNNQASAALQNLSQIEQAQEAQRVALENEKKQRSQVLSQLSTQIDAQRNAIDKLKRDEANLTQVVENLMREIAEQAEKRRLAKERAKQAEKNKPAPSTPSLSPEPKSSNAPVARNTSLPEPFEGGNFSALRGKLSLPVRGEVMNNFGDARADTGVSWKGIFIRSSEGNEVKAVAKGRVVFADWMRGFGNLLIIDHGDGYMSLYGNNQSLLRKVGDVVQGGDTIAAVGNTGGNEASGLYYELRKLSKPFDPLSWSIVR